jgi:hypothetical protein
MRRVWKGVCRSGAFLGLIAACTVPNPRFRPRVDAAGAPQTLPDGASSPDQVPPCVACATPDAPAEGGGDTGVVADRPPTADAVARDAAGDPALNPATARYSFESSVQGWQDQHYDYFQQVASRVVRSTAMSFDGIASIAITLKTTASYHTPEIGVAQSFGAALPGGTVITYHLWFPAGSAIEGVQPYLFYFRPGAAAAVFAGIDPIIYATELNAGGWSTITHRVPADVDSRGVIEVGLEWRTNGAQTVTVYMDAITW